MKQNPHRMSWCSPDSYTLVVDSYRWKMTAHPHLWRPPTDVYEIEDAVVVRIEVAGIREQDLEISLDGRLLSVRGFRSDVTERRAYHQIEIPFGEFGVQVELPFSVATDQIQACYQDGFLKVFLPKTI
ncbi:MAG: Hsp20/alpha crystallin family protein [Chloroflexota bacterium]